MKIFWCWQSDIPGKVGRHFVRDALNDAIAQLRQAPDVEEPTERERREAIHLDSDRQGVSGSPDLASLIFSKIREAAVVVADVTLVGKTPNQTNAAGESVAGKKLINSNVAIELGYSLHALTDRKVILVFNAHCGSYEELPFDLRHKGGAVAFNLPPNADKKQIEQQKKKLTSRFVSELKFFVEASAPASVPFPVTPSTFNKAVYFGRDEHLARRNNLGLSYGTESLCYLRLIPTTPLASPLKTAKLKGAAGRAPLLHTFAATTESAHEHNRYGAISYQPGDTPPGASPKIACSTQLFANGEIWCISAKLIVREIGERPAWAKVPILSPGSFERAYFDALRAVVAFATREMGVSTPWQVELGGVGIRGVGIPVDNYGTTWGPIEKEEVIHRVILNSDDADAINRVLLDFFEAVCDASAHERPANWHGFPPNQPH